MQTDDVLKQQLISRENDYWMAVKEKNAEAAARLSDDPCMVVGAEGVRELSKNVLSGMLREATFEIHGFTLDDVHFRRLGSDVAALAYRVNEELTVNGERIKLQAFDSSVWMKRNGDWICVVHTESLAGDSFGRH